MENNKLHTMDHSYIDLDQIGGVWQLIFKLNVSQSVHVPFGCSKKNIYLRN